MHVETSPENTLSYLCHRELAALRRSCALFVRLLITDEVRLHGLPCDRPGGIVLVLRSACFNHCALGIAQGKHARSAPQGIPHALDQFEPFTDCQPVDVDRWIQHASNLWPEPVGDN